MCGTISRKLLNDRQECWRKRGGEESYRNREVLCRLARAPLSSKVAASLSFLNFSASTALSSNSRVQTNRRVKVTRIFYRYNKRARGSGCGAKRIERPTNHDTGHLGHERCTANSSRSWTLGNFLRPVECWLGDRLAHSS